ncbi:S8 family peptidase [Thermaerobacillus caldiproteolyticus]|uniref:Subtilisin family serine protease n=1 Tax=Thermaerobacillus caldiproteolyticus TaxID=247480 RepID=A0A7W0BYI6_9BACL|nr:S8 family serine peptidase [Anoxybacillus caldiproteolyticus]MBA2874600.1 subtilisin family serine protease [Anoxybacillus caldiproteolyticus]
MKRLQPIVFVLLVSFFLFHPNDAHGQSLSEWLIYFDDEADYSQFIKHYTGRVEDQERVEDQADGWVVKALFSKDEIETIKQSSIVSRVEPNYKKRLASFIRFNDPLFSQQWGIQKVDVASIMDQFHDQNLLYGKQIAINHETLTYEGQPLHASNVFILSEDGMKLSRLSVELDHAEGAWTLDIVDEQGERIAANTGYLPKLDVLIPKNKVYKKLQVVIKADGWTQIPVIKNITAVNHVLVAVVDTGASLHKDFCGNVLHSLGKDYVDGEGIAIDENGHGTHVTGIISACPNNGEGIAGVTGFAPVDVIPLKVLDGQGTGSDFEIAQAVNDAVTFGADVINLSLAGKGKTLVLESAIQNALHHHVAVVAAAGNWGTLLQDVYPASYPGVITVAAINENNEMMPYSDYGWKIDLSAPGANIMSTYLNDSYQSLSGTSMATPFVTSAVALLKAAHPELDVIQIRKRLFQSALDIREKGYDIYSGHGVVQIAKAFQLPFSEAIDWLTIKDNQPVDTSQPQLLGVSNGLIGKDIYIFIEDQFILKRKIDSDWLSVALSTISSVRNEKKLTVVCADETGKIVAADERWMNPPSTSPASFSDVPTTFWAYREIQQAYSQKLINGFADNTFRPNQYLTRRHAVMMMNRLFHWPFQQIRSPFTDTPLTLGGALPIYSAYDQQIIKGYNNGKFYPENFVTRAQMAVMLARALKLSENSFSGTPYSFKDLSDSGHFAYYAVQQLASKGIITKQEYFRPNEFLTRAQFAAMMVRTYEYISKNS